PIFGLGQISMDNVQKYPNVQAHYWLKLYVMADAEAHVTNMGQK
ncbi:3679_t:CDS:1, partial [Gigaspora margarita]